MDTVRETSTLIAANKVEGTDVFNAGGDRVGSIHDLMIDKRSGQVAYAIMAFGGFLGVWNSYHPLPWSLLQYNTNLGGYVVDIKQSRARRRAILSARDGTGVGRPRIRAQAARLLRRQSVRRPWRAPLTLMRPSSEPLGSSPDGQARRRFIPPLCSLPWESIGLRHSLDRFSFAAPHPPEFVLSDFNGLRRHLRVVESLRR